MPNDERHVKQAAKGEEAAGVIERGNGELQAAQRAENRQDGTKMKRLLEAGVPGHSMALLL
jgi:hypothetical protein